MSALNPISFDQLEFLRTAGYIVVKDFLSPSRCEVYKHSLEAMIEEDLGFELRDSRDVNMVHNPMLRDSIFYELLSESALTKIMSQVLGESFIMYAFTTSSLPPKGTNWSRRIHVDCPRLIPGYPTNMNAFIPLSDITEKNGGIELLPNSHWRNQEPSLTEFDQGRLVPEINAGSLLIFYSRLWHSGGFNTSTDPRHALTINFCRSFMRQRFDYPRMVPSSDLEALDETQRQLLGYNVRVPSSMSEYYLPEAERLYKSNQG